jgi:hypothetical protein
MEACAGGIDQVPVLDDRVPRVLLNVMVCPVCGSGAFQPAHGDGTSAVDFKFGIEGGRYKVKTGTGHGKGNAAGCAQEGGGGCDGFIAGRRRIDRDVSSMPVPRRW